ncbi:MAG: hypothetical protein PUG48_05230 [Clostridia bacterium]|nr:hypothetical protein [Clostridia bacterium]
MNYLYSGIWFVVAVLLYVRFRKESKTVYLLSGYFTFMGFWWLADEIFPVDLLKGTYAWILRGVSFVLVLCLLLIYLRGKSKKSTSQESETDEKTTVTQESSEK